MKPSSEGLADIGAMLSAKPWEWRDWQCPTCGHEEAVPPGKDSPASCWNCEMAAFRLSKRVGLASREDALRIAGVPDRFRMPFHPPARWGKLHGFSLDQWTGREPHPLTHQRMWALLLTGVAEGGKTMLATELFWRSLERGGGPGLWIRADDLLSRLMGALGRDEREEANVRLRSSRVLMIDDLDRGVSDAQLEHLMTPMAIRHQNLSPTVITMQRPMEHLHRVNAALARRLEEDSLIVPFQKRWSERETSAQ